MKSSLAGVRVQIAGSLPSDADSSLQTKFDEFVFNLALKIFCEGGTVIHGSHPSVVPSLERAVKVFKEGGGDKRSLVLARSEKFAVTMEDQRDIKYQSEYSIVQVIPSEFDAPHKNLDPMREWMADRSDIVVAFGGKWWDVSKPKAGVPVELENMLQRRKPGFAISSFGGAMKGYIQDNPMVLGELLNGMNFEQNGSISNLEDPVVQADNVVTQMKLLALCPPQVTEGHNFRILALDGGGIRGVFTAAVLARWDDMLHSQSGVRLADHFDMIAGTSTGAIIAIGLGLGISPLKILEFYQQKGPLIFPKDRKLRHWVKSKHDSGTLKTVLREIFGAKKLSKDSRSRLVIPTVRAVRGESESIVTAHSPDRTAFREISAVDAALASSAAPTYFDESVWDAPIVPESYLDGGIWANNPIIPALAETVRFLEVPLNRIDVLSLGTVGFESDFRVSLGKGKLGWGITSGTDLFFAAQEHAALKMAENFLGPVRHLRVNQRTPSEIKMDDTEAIGDLIERGNSVAKDSFSSVRSRFLDGVAAPDWRDL